jgi:serine/threonine protein phosphatase PrpC
MIIYYTSVKGRRETNEDKHNIVLNLDGSSKKCNAVNLFGIYDGHGGPLVSEYLHKNIPKYYCRPHHKIPFSKEYHNLTFEQIQKKILDTNYGFDMGSTCLLNIMYKYKNEYHMNIVNIGDSRMCIVYKNGHVQQITTDHKPDDISEKKRIEALGGEIYLDSEGVYRIGDLSLSKAFGDGDNIHVSQKPDVFYKKICEMTYYIVMGCDGLWDVVKNDELYSLLEEFKKQKKTNLASGLATECLNRNCSDNISIIVIEINDKLTDNNTTVLYN